MFAIIIDITGSARLSILALTFFFIVGILLLTRVNTVKEVTS
jgi:MFS-type transporter involved in bile tolerance (Atg22 family)